MNAAYRCWRWVVLLRGLAAAIVLIALSVGTPLLLSWLTAIPIPDHVPSLSEVSAVLMRPDDGTLLLYALKLIAWGAWALVTYTIVVEVAARIRGRARPAHLLGLGGVQRLVASLVASASLAIVTPTALAAPPPPPVAVAAPPHPLVGPSALASAPQPKGAHEETYYRVKRGDTLSKIAERELGGADRWPRIWHLNAFRRQSDGRVFRKPDLIRPGWRLRLTGAKPTNLASGPDAAVVPAPSPSPATPSPVPSPMGSTGPPVTPDGHSVSQVAVRSYPRPSARVHRALVITIELPSGTVVGLTFAAGVTACLAATRLHRRRRRVLPPASAGVTIEPEPVPEPAVQALHQAHLRAEFTDHDQPPPPDADLVKAAFSIEVPDAVTVGVRHDGEPCEVRLAGLNLALDGPGADDVARAMILDLLMQAEPCRAQIVMTVADASNLLGPEACDVDAGRLPGLKLLPTHEAAIEMAEAEHLTRTELTTASGATDVRQLLQADPGEVLPATLLVTAANGEGVARLQALTDAGARYGLGVLFLGTAAAGTRCHVEVDGNVSAASGSLAADLRGADLFLVDSEDAPQLLRVIASSHDLAVEDGAADTDGQDDDRAQETEDEDAHVRAIHPLRQPQSEPAEQRSVRLLLLGVPIVEADGREVPFGRRTKALELLIYLAVNPDGVTREEICARLWPDYEAGERFHSTLRHLRDALRDVTGLKKAMFVQAEGDRYRIRPEMFSIDLWDFQRALADTRSASDTASRIAALEKAAALVRGKFAEGTSYDWIDEERYPLVRAQCDVLAQLAELIERRDPDRALAALEQARILDPDAEEIYVPIIRLQLHLGREDAARRTARLLQTRLADLDVQPRPETQQLFGSLSGSRRSPIRRVGSENH